MALEAFAQLSDALSFVLITPEFLSDRRLQQLRTRLEFLIGATGFIVSFDGPPEKPGGDPTLRLFRKIPVSSFGTILGLAFVLGAIAKFGVISSSVKMWADIAAMSMTAIWLLAVMLTAGGIVFLLFLLALHRMAVRGTMFITGVTLFFITRALLFWYA